MGTCDILCKMGESDDVYVLDVKTGKQIYDEVELQLSAYKQGLNENGIKCDRMGVILLETGADNKPTGEYIFATKSYNFETFLACKKVWEWQNESLCHKVEYETGKY